MLSGDLSDLLFGKITLICFLRKSEKNANIHTHFMVISKGFARTFCRFSPDSCIILSFFINTGKPNMGLITGVGKNSKINTGNAQYSQQAVENSNNREE